MNQVTPITIRQIADLAGVSISTGTDSNIQDFFVRGRTRFKKTVHFYLMRPIGGALEDHDHEFDEVAWFQLEEALELMTHATERAVVEEAAALLGAQRPAAASAREAAS